MKKLYSLLLLAFASVSFGQTIYSENMGIPSGTTTIPLYITGTAPATFQNGTPIVYSGTGDVRTSTPSTGYTGFSAGGNVFLTSTAGKYFQIDGINTSAYTSANIQMTFGYLTATFATVQVILEYSTNASAATPTWTPITFTNNTTNGWNLVSIPGGVLPSSTTLSLRFTQPAVAGQIRIDDIKVFNYNPACTLVLGTPTGVCDAVTSGIDTYTATIPYTGGGTGTYTITPSSGTVSGDNPNTVAAGNIIITGINEGTNLSLTAVNGSCSYSATLTAPECKAVNSLPYSEPFPYTLGSTLGSSQKWTNVNSGDEILSVSPSLTYTGLTSSGNAVSFSGAGIDCHSPFTATTVADLTLYSSFLINVTDYSTITTDGTQDYFAAITDGVTTNFKCKLFIKKSGTQYQLGLSSAAGSTATNYDTTNLFNVGDVVYVVLGYDFQSNTLKAWFNPVISTFTSATTPNLTDTPTATITTLGGFMLRQSTGVPTMTVDELRIATTIPGLLTSNQVSSIAGLSVYPNPVKNGIFYINTDANAQRTVTVFDVLGKQVLNTKTSDSAVNVSSLHSGVYVVQITEEGKTSTKKLVIE